MANNTKLNHGINHEYANKIINMQTSKFAALLGAEVIELGDGLCRLRQPGDDKLTNLYGGIHGGVTATLADIAMGVALRTIGLHPMTVELTVNYLGTAPSSSELIAEGRIVHKGSSLILAEFLMTTTDGKIVARGRGLYMIRKITESDNE
jgi:acyl-CoA thioesterase